MDIETILKKLERYDGTFPREALEAAIQQREEITPHLLDALQFTREHAEDLPEDYFLHTWAMFLLAQFRETRAYPLVVSLLDFPKETLDALHGDSLTEDMSRILASVCGGDTRLIEGLAEGPHLDEFVRAAALSALVCLVVAGQRSREETLEYFRHLFHTARAEPDSFFRSALVNDSTDLYPDLVQDEIRAAFARNLVDPFVVSPADVEATLADGKEATLAKVAANPHNHLVEDTIRETEWWYCFQPAAQAPEVAEPAKAWTGNAPPVLRSVAARWQPSPVPQPVSVGPKPGRNDPCPCGSGLKYKKCCLKKNR